MLMSLLSELSYLLQLEEEKRVGRPRTDLHEMIFCLTLKTYTKLSSRRLISDLRIAQRLGYISHVPHFTTIMKYFNLPEIYPILKRLIHLSCLPLKQVETDFAVDATGFSTSQFGRWMEYKHGGDKRHRVWRKAHVMCGVKTNVISSIEVTLGYRADSPEFVGLVNSTSQRFKIKEVAADKAYISRQNLQAVVDVGGIPYIPFRSNIKGKSRGCLTWKKMFEFFKTHRQEFLEHYHKRSNVESTFYMMKQKFGSNLITKSFTAHQNEILTKALCHNLVVLIQEYFEQNLQIIFSTQTKKKQAIQVKAE
jgi:transposase